MNERDAGAASTGRLTRERIRAFPKISLHDHLDGGLRIATVIELAREESVELPSYDESGLAEWIGERAAAGSLVEYLRSDEITTAVTQTPDALFRIAHEAVEDLARDGVVYAELRWAPEAVLDSGLAMPDAVRTVQSGLESGMRSSRSRGDDIAVAQILCAMRNDVNSLDVARLAVRFRDDGVVGFDIAGPERGYPPSRHRAAFDYLARNDMPVTVHAGEADGLDSIRSALDDGRARRLGHGIRIAEDIQVGADGTVLGPLARRVRDTRTALETSPTSNLNTGAISPWGSTMKDHPFDLLYRNGFCVTVNPDNRLTSATTLTDEIHQLSLAFGYDIRDLETFQLTAIEASFQPVGIRDELARRVRAAGAESAVSR